MADKKILNDADIGGLAGGLALADVKEALASPVFKDDLLKRLPAGTVLDEATLAKLAGGLERLASSLAGGLGGGLGGGLAGGGLAGGGLAGGSLASKADLASGLAMPEKFASPTEMEDWIEMIRAKIISGGDIGFKSGGSGNNGALQ